MSYAKQNYQPMNNDPNMPPPPGNMDQPPQFQNNPYNQQIPQSMDIQQPNDMNQPFNENDHLPQVPGHLQPIPDLNQSANWWQTWQQDKLKLNENYRLFRVPKLKEDIKDSTIIGVIDQSGSMGDCFHWLAKEWNTQIRDQFPRSKCCIFHNFAQEQPCLEEEPDMGTTDVEAGFTLLNQVLNRDETLGYVTIIFVSDGMDNNASTIYRRLDALVQQIPKYKKINFLTIGVGEGFPTFMAMQLRQMYHNGENNIPPVFLVYNQHVHENWKVTFGVVNKYLAHNDPVQMNTMCQQFPWSPPTQTVYENSWVFTTNMSCTSLNFQNQLQIEHIQNLTPQEVLDISSILLSNAQLHNLKYGTPDNTKASITVSNKVLEDLKKKFWGRRNKKKEEKEQLTAVQQEMKDLEKDPDLKSKKSQQGGDNSLALKLAVGAVGAGIGLYWLAGNYGDFANIMSGMNFQGTPECGCCGEICEPVCNTMQDSCECCGDMADKIMESLNCGSCGDCMSGAAKVGGNCLEKGCSVLGDVLGYVCNFICGLLGG